MDAIRTEYDLDRLRQGASAWAVVAAWQGAGLFDALADGTPKSAEALPADSRAIEICAPVLTHLGLLMRSGGGWALTGSGRQLYDRGALSNLGGAAQQIGGLSRLDAVMQEGGPVRDEAGARIVTEGGVRESEPEAARNFMNRLYRRSESDVAEMVRWVGERLPSGAKVLDLGGGHGRYVWGLVEAIGAEATLFDRPVCLDVARERFGDSMAYISGDFQADPLGGPYDAVILSNIIHGLGPDENRDLFRKIHKSLAPGGMVIVKDMFIADNWTSPATAVLFGITMLMLTRQGQTYREKDFEAICADAGFSRFEAHHLADRGHSLLFVGKAPAA